MRVMLSGESHGACVGAVLEGFPAGFTPDINLINRALSLRNSYYGRGKRMKIESDKVSFTGGLVNDSTYGAPISFVIKNMDDRSTKDRPKVTVPRPGHADFAASVKYNLDDVSIPSEFSGGRLTAPWVVIGELSMQFLSMFGINVLGFTLGIGGINSDRSSNFSFDEGRKSIERSQLRLIDDSIELKLITLIDEAAAQGDSLGGLVSVVADGLPVGLGSPFAIDKRLDSKLSFYIMGIPAVKGLEIGEGFCSQNFKGSEYHDALFMDDVIFRKTNHAGGIEGGVSNGERIIIRAVMKPLPSIKTGLPSIDISDGSHTFASYVRSDTCAVPSLAQIIESVVSYVILDSFLEKFAGDTVFDIRRNFISYMERIKLWAKTSI